MRVGKTFRVEAEQGRLQHVSNLTKYEQYINVDDIEMDVFIFPISKMPNLDASKIMDWNLMFPPTESSSTDIPASLMQRETATQITPGPGLNTLLFVSPEFWLACRVRSDNYFIFLLHTTTTY